MLAASLHRVTMVLVVLEAALTKVCGAKQVSAKRAKQHLSAATAGLHQIALLHGTQPPLGAYVPQVCSLAYRGTSVAADTPCWQGIRKLDSRYSHHTMPNLNTAGHRKRGHHLLSSDNTVR